MDTRLRSQPGRGCALPARRPREPRYVPPALPTIEPDAIWQPGVTAGSEKIKVLFNGEPDPRIVAAGVTDGIGWVLLAPEPELTKVRAGRHAPRGVAYLTDPLTSPRRVYGRITLLAIKDDE